MGSPLLDAILEGDWQETVIGCARVNGWLLTHFRPARTDQGWRTPLQGDKGFPDLVLLRAPRLIFAELKRQRAKPSADQERWLEELLRAGQEAYVWRPGDWDEVQRILGKEAGQGLLTR
jgi:hypothetical protein